MEEIRDKVVPFSTNDSISVKGSISYEENSDVVTLIQPNAFSGEIQLQAYHKNTMIGKYNFQNGNPSESFYYQMIHDGKGGGSYKITNMPGSLIVDGELITITSYLLVIEQTAYFKECTQAINEIGGENDTQYINVDFLLVPRTRKVTIQKVIPGGNADNNRDSFEMKLIISIPNTEQSITKRINVTLAKNAEIEVPIGLQCFVQEENE